MTDKFLILGSNSFVGSNLINELLLKEKNVIGVSRSLENNQPLVAYYNNLKKTKLFNFYKIDLNKNFSELKQLLKKHKPNYIVDFAAQSMVNESWKWPEHWYQTNIVSKVKLHNYLLNSDYLEKYIRISTPEVFGNKNGKITELSKFNPSTPYAVSQAAIDMSLNIFCKNFKFPVIFNRFSNFYGSFQQLYRIIPLTILSALSHATLTIHGKGDSTRSFIHHKDVTSGIKKSIILGQIGETYHFSTEEYIKINQLVKIICDKLSVNFDDIVKFSEDRLGKDKSYRMVSTKAKDKLNWSPRYNLDKGIDETINWVKKNIKELKKLPKTYIHKI